MCVCVFFQFILDIKFVRRTSRGHTGGRSHRISPPPSFCGACLNLSREKDSAIPFPRRPCSRILCTNDLIVLHPLAFLVLVLSFLVRKIPLNAIISTQSRDMIKSGLTRWRLTGENIGFSLSVENQQAGAGRDGPTSLSQDQTPDANGDHTGNKNTSFSAGHE